MRRCGYPRSGRPARDGRRHRHREPWRRLLFARGRRLPPRQPRDGPARACVPGGELARLGLQRPRAPRAPRRSRGGPVGHSARRGRRSRALRATGRVRVASRRVLRTPGAVRRRGAARVGHPDGRGPRRQAGQHRQPGLGPPGHDGPPHGRVRAPAGRFHGRDGACSERAERGALRRPRGRRRLRRAEPQRDRARRHSPLRRTPRGGERAAHRRPAGCVPGVQPSRYSREDVPRPGRRRPDIRLPGDRRDDGGGAGGDGLRGRAGGLRPLRRLQATPGGLRAARGARDGARPGGSAAPSRGGALLPRARLAAASRPSHRRRQGPGARARRSQRTETPGEFRESSVSR